MKKRKLKLFMPLLIIAVLLAGCGESKPKPEETVTKFMESLKKVDWQDMAGYVKDSDWKGEDEDLMGEESMQDFFTNTLEKMTYTVGESKIDGDNATVPVDIKYYDGTDLISQIMGEYFSKAMGIALSGQEMSDEEATKMLGDMFSEKTQDLEDTYDEISIDFKCVKEDDKWVISDLDDNFLNVVTSNFNKVSEDMANSFSDENGQPAEESNVQFSPDDGTIDFTCDDFSIKYTNHELSYDYEGNQCLLVYFDFTNNSSDNTSALVTTGITAYQNGVECNSAYYDSSENESVSNYDKNIQPGTTLNIALAFEISDLSDVTLDVSEAFSFSGQKDTMILTLQ